MNQSKDNPFTHALDPIPSVLLKDFTLTIGTSLSPASSVFLPLTTFKHVELSLIQKKLQREKVSQDFLVSRGEYLTAKLLAEYVGYTFIDGKVILDYPGGSMLFIRVLIRGR